MSWPSGDPRRELRVTRLRQAAASGQPRVNGIASVRVVEEAGSLSVVCELLFAPTAEAPILPSDISITGGIRRPRIGVTGLAVDDATLTIRVAERGDFSLYELALRRDGKLLPGFDPLLSDVPVAFRLECQHGFDCQTEPPLEAEPPAVAAIDFQARDYHGFRRLMLDRFAQLTPGFRDPGAASAEVALIELLAHVADRIAYAQDAVATEAYLHTARRRVSAKRHARLVDYRTSDGNNARTFVHIGLRAPSLSSAPLTATASKGTRFMTRAAGVGAASAETPAVVAARAAGAQLFEAMHTAKLSSAHNRIVIHDWLESITALPKGATRMELVDEGRRLSLAAGDFLLLEEVLDERGNASPDPTRRQVLRLTSVNPMLDPIGKLAANTPEPLEILAVEWAPADALTMTLPLSRLTSTDEVDGIPPGPNQPTLVARGNLLCVDHGEWRGEESLLPRRRPGRRRFMLPLSEGPITQAAPYAPAESALETLQPAERAKPQLTVTRDAGAGSDPSWTVVDEIFLEAGQQLVIDIEEGGKAALRTGTLANATHFDASVPFLVRYRLGDGTQGNVGAEAIAHLLTEQYVGPGGALVVGLSARPGDVAVVRNPLPAKGGAEPETLDQVRLRAPTAFREQDRAVTPDDYARYLMQDPLVAGARAVEQWTGAARAIVLLVDLIGGGSLNDELERRFRRRLERVRLAGHQLEFRDPALVPIELGMRVCVKRGVPRDAVLKQLMLLFSSGRLRDGRPALFHPDNFGFGSPLRLSQLYAAAQGVDGVAHVEITSFRRQGVPTDDVISLDSGSLLFGPYEIPVLANDPNFPDKGLVQFVMEGGA